MWHKVKCFLEISCIDTISVQQVWKLCQPTEKSDKKLEVNHKSPLWKSPLCNTSSENVFAVGNNVECLNFCSGGGRSLSRLTFSFSQSFFLKLFKPPLSSLTEHFHQHFLSFKDDYFSREGQWALDSGHSDAAHLQWLSICCEGCHWTFSPKNP